MVDINDFERQSECVYKEEHYLVRDNGAVMRLPKEGKHARPLDNTWTFGKANKKGYLELCGQRVHRIVAYAFLGEPQSVGYVVDHIDTNRRNNRPENLRWLTRLENVLNNPITRARIENLCGSIDSFLANPSILRGHEKIDSKFSWMREVTKEEAQICLIKLRKWAENPSKPTGLGLGEWVFQEGKSQNVRSKIETTINYQDNPFVHVQKPVGTTSLTPNVIQLNWKNPAEFPLCPQKHKGKPLEEYRNNLEVGKVFCKNSLGESSVLDFGMSNPDTLWVMCDIQLGFKTHAITKITYKDEVYYHENYKVLDYADEPEDYFASIISGSVD